jgi:spore germination protein
MAVAPINEVEKVIKYAVTVIPRNKIMMGMPFYGYDWSLPYVPKGEFAEAIGNEEAVVRAAKHGAEIKFDRLAMSPYYNYTQAGINHVVWFEDARSVLAKYLLKQKYSLKGVSYWSLGKPFQQNFTVLESLFNVVKG